MVALTVFALASCVVAAAIGTAYFMAEVRPRLSWYNRPREFSNGITWCRVDGTGWGLWWTTRGYERGGAPISRLRVRCGRYAVAVLTPQKTHKRGREGDAE